MPINDTLSRYSDLAFASTVISYLLALLLLIAAYAMTSTPAPEAAERRRVLVGAAMTPGRVIEPPRRSLPDRLGRMGLNVVYAAWMLHVTSIALRGLATGRAPWGNMYEFVTLTCAAAVAAGFVVLRTPRLRPLWVFVLIPVLILLFVAGTVLYATAAPVVPALQSYWLRIHVSVISLGSGVLLISGVASLLFLLRIRYPEGTDGRGVLGRLARRLPDAQSLDRLAYRTTIFAFPVFGAGVVLGAVWAEAAWGRFWGWDPKETTSFVAFIVYAAYLHARATAGWRTTRAAWINVAGFAAMLFNLFIVNMVVSGLHSYAGLN
jgi:cytochrome c-type biogenesis protein CcsB